MRTEDLDGLTQAYPDCLMSAYADIDTGITLLTNSDNAFPREALDELCTEAALTLGQPAAPPLGANPCELAIKADDAALFVYLRAPGEPTDALVCVCRPGIDLDGFLAAAQACLAADDDAEGSA